MSKFTKGEWEYGKNGKFPFWYVGVKGTTRYLATVDKEANARLIAAAPEMYELLSDCAAFLKDCGDCSPIAYQLRLRIEELLARIDDEEAHS